MHFCSDSNVGGAGITLYRLLSNSDKSTFEHYVVLPYGSALIDLFSKCDVHIIKYNSSSDCSASFSLTSELRKIIFRISPHIVHTHGLASARLAAFLCGVKSRIYTRHTYNETVTGFLSKVLNRTVTTKAIAVNGALAEQIKESGIKVKDVVLIENGCERFKREACEKNKTFTLLYHGRIEKSKGLPLAIEAVSKLVCRGYSLRLLIVGEGSCKNELIALAEKLNVSQHIIFVGYTDDVSKFISMSDAALNCSYEAEGTSNSVIECMSAGVPVIISSVKGNAAVVSDGVDGLIFDCGKVDSLVLCIERLVCDSELYSKISVGAYKTYLARFTVEKMTQRYERLWKDEYKNHYEK